MKCWRQLLGNQNSIQSMEKSGVTSTEEGKASKKQHQVNVGLFLWSERNCSQRIVPPGQTVNAAFYIEVLKRLQENFWRKRPDQWRNNTWLLHHDKALPTCPTLHPATFSYFQNWKWSLRGEDFRPRKFKQSRRLSWTRYEKVTSKNASKTGSATGNVVKPQKGTTVKVTPTPNV